MEESVRTSLTGGIADVRLVRPDKMNALDDAMFTALVAAGETLKAAAGLRAVVLSGEGRGFCAGLDTASFAAIASGSHRGGAGLIDGPLTAQGANRAQQACLVWREVPVPVIAAVHGIAYGGGLQIALGADLRIVARGAKLGFLEIKWGIVPDMGGITLARHFLRDDVLRDLVYTGRVFDGEEALALGMATRLSDDPYTDAMAIARDIAGMNPDAVRAAKRLANLALFAAPKDMLAAEACEQAKLIGSPNQIEAVMANVQKRLPAFRD